MHHIAYGFMKFMNRCLTSRQLIFFIYKWFQWSPPSPPCIIILDIHNIFSKHCQLSQTANFQNMFQRRWAREIKSAANFVKYVSSKASTWTEYTTQLFNLVCRKQFWSHVFSLRRLLQLRSAVALEARFTNRSFMCFFRTRKRSCTAGCKFRIIWIASIGEWGVAPSIFILCPRSKKWGGRVSYAPLHTVLRVSGKTTWLPAA